MRSIFAVFIIIIPFTGLLANTDSLYQSAIDAYEQGSYESSLAQFREVLDRGVESPLLYYNAGNAAYRSNHLGYSILYYEKALKMDPGLDEANYNLNFVSQFKSDRLEQVPELFIRQWVKALVSWLPEKTWAIISLAAFLIFLSGTMIYIFSGHISIKKAGFFTALATLLFFIFSLSAANAQHKKIIDPDSGIIIAPSVVVKSSPSESGNDLFIIHEGTKVVIEEEVSDWWNIRIIDGRTGWVPAESFLSI